MGMTYATLLDLVSQFLQDTSNATWADAELNLYIANQRVAMSQQVPYIRRYSYTFEKRWGTASSTTASALVDATKAQFASTDTNKVIHNVTDDTWAIVTAYVSASQLTLSKDIMASGEQYEIYNKECHAWNEINIEDVDDYIGGQSQDDIAIEYPVGSGKLRNWELTGDDNKILKVLIADATIEDTNPTLSPVNVNEVWVYFKHVHFLSQLTDFAGAVNNAGGYAAGSVSMAINGLQASGTIQKGQEFTLASDRGKYRVTADATITTNAATISFYPGLESAVTNADVITLVQTTLTPDLEVILAELATAEANMSKSGGKIDTFNITGNNVWKQYQEKALYWQDRAMKKLNKLTKPRTTQVYSRY